jgi:sensor histidine kinase YesM
MITSTEKIGVWPSISDISPFLILDFIWAAAIFYLFYFYFIRYFEQRKFVWYLVYSIGSSIIVAFLFLFILTLFYKQLEIFNNRYLLPQIAGTFIIAQCGCLIRGFENWFTDITFKKELENQNLRNELEILKSQVNPHFLFNTLNNIDSLIHTSAKHASDALVTLSDILRYMIYETSVDKVPLDKEINYIQNYIKLQSLRFRNHDYVKISLPEMCQGSSIAPVLLIPLIENAFKHSKDIGKYPVIDLLLTCKNNSLLFTCANTIKNTHSEGNPNKGIGLENTRRRLELLYPGKHQLSISKEDNMYKVELQIDLQ